MIGKQYVRTRVASSEINLNAWTEENVLQVCREALIDRDDESKNLCSHWIDRAIAAPLSTIKAFLGDSEALHGGTMGEPISQPDYVLALRKFFWKVIVDIGITFDPPYLVLNADEKTSQTMSNYIWYAFIDRWGANDWIHHDKRQVMRRSCTIITDL